MRASILGTVLYAVLLVAALTPDSSSAQLVDLQKLTRGAWVVDSEVINTYGKDSSTVSNDSGFYLFVETEMACFDMPVMPALLARVWGYTDIIGKGPQLTRHSCPDYYGFIGAQSRRDREHNIIICGEHWPYIARFRMLSDSTFKLSSENGSDYLSTKYFRRIPVPKEIKEY